jgi:hypothetical protein
MLAHCYPIQRPAAGSVWDGKKLLVDFDGTLADCKRKDGGGYDLERVREGARETLASVNARKGRCFITSAACDGYIKEMAGRAGLLDIFEKVFDCDDLKVLAAFIGNSWWATAKNYNKVMDHIGEANPEHNCAIIGNDPGLDVPKSPKGVVTVLANMERSMPSIVRFLESMLVVGEGSFSVGFDILSRRRLMFVDDTRVTLLREDSWIFRGMGTGQAKVVLFGMEPSQIMYHLP